MIARIQGILLEKSLASVTLDVGGVGYRVFVPLTAVYDLPEAGATLVLHIHTHVREDAIQLFGFPDSAQRDLFQMMIAVSGIGPRLAMNILSGIAPDELAEALSRGDLARLTRVPGVGRKMAERMVLELRERVLKAGFAKGQRPGEAPAGPSGVEEDVLSALLNLGYKEAAAQKAIEAAAREIPVPASLDGLLKGALRVLSG
jgi:Holliday junction DNA helicase RuvA